MSRIRAEDPARNSIPIRLTDDELAAFDALRLPGESRSGVVRRLLERVIYASKVAKARRLEESAPAPQHVADTAIVFDVDPLDLGPLSDGSKGPALGEFAVVDSPSGVVLHESVEKPLPLALTPKAREEREPIPDGARTILLGFLALLPKANNNHVRVLRGLRAAIDEMLDEME